MASHITQVIAELYSKRHHVRKALFGDKPYANFGYWPRPGMTIEEAGDALTEWVATAAGIGPGDRVLEVGCGYAAATVHYTQRYRPASVIGLDVTEVRIHDGREYVARHDLAGVIELRLGDATALDFPPETFTKVLAIECAFHFDTRCDFLREAARVLVPGGILALTDVIPKRGVDPLKFARSEPPLCSNVSIDVPANNYDADVYEAHLRAAGFEEVRIESCNELTRFPFTEYLDRLETQVDEETAVLVRRTAQRSRDHTAAGADYVLVTARKAASEGRPQ